MAKVKKEAVVQVRYMIPVDNLFARDSNHVLAHAFKTAGLDLWVEDDSRGSDYRDSAIQVQYDSLEQAVALDARVRKVIESIKWSKIKQLPEWRGRV